MGTTTLVYTILPDATWLGPKLRATVAVAPRLTAGTRVADFPEITSWPSRIGGEIMGVLIDNVEYAAMVLPKARAAEALDVGLWNRLFPPKLLVRPFSFENHLTRPVFGFPASAIAQRILDLYTSVAQMGGAVPRVLDVGQLHGCDPPVTNDPATAGSCAAPGYEPGPVDLMLLDIEAAVGAILDPDSAGALSPNARILYDGLRFYRRGDTFPSEPPAEPHLDFHERIALLGDHPTLLRRLGLAFDIEIDVGPAVLGPSGTLQALPKWRGVTQDDICPRTLYRWDRGQFEAGGGLATDGGYLRLDDPAQFSVLQVDTDGGLMGLETSMLAIRQALTDPFSPPQHEQTLPALRSGGFTIAHTNRTGWLSDRFISQQRLEFGNPAARLLFADDLVRGYRIDVEEGGAWQSLCRRRGSIFDRAGNEIVRIPAIEDDNQNEGEEGFLKAASASSPIARPSELYLHEAVVSWSGFSLCAKPGGKTIAFTPGKKAHEKLIQNRNNPGRFAPLASEYTVTPGTLPKLRFGQFYRLRARVCDLAGGGLPWDDGDTSHASPPLKYLRFEPVPPPVLVPQAPVSQAESLEHMVVRTDPGGTATYEIENKRHVLAPKTSLDLWEKHGMFEVARRAGWSAESVYQIARRERGTLTELGIQEIDGTITSVIDRVLCNKPSSAKPTSNKWPNRGEPLSDGQYVISKGERVRLPWLADPASYGLVVWDEAGNVAVRAFKPRTDFPANQGFLEPDSLRVILHATANDTAPRLERGTFTNRDLEVFLPPGDRMILRYASIPHPEALEAMGIWNLLTAADHAAFGDVVRQGRHWMLTPSRELVLVHAAQRPAEPPSFVGAVDPEREAGEGRVRIVTEVLAHAHSTSHVDVEASWAELEDVPGTVLPIEPARVRNDAFRLAFDYDDGALTTRRTTTTVERRPTTVVTPTVNLGMVNLGTLLAIREKAKTETLGHDLPDTKRRIVTYKPVGTTRYQEYFPTSVIADPSQLESAGEGRVVSVPASAPPLMPEIAEVLPTFRWEGSGNARMRLGGGLRIYLERPWFSSGVGERLAILLPKVPSNPPLDWISRLSRWGADAAWSSTVRDPLGTEHFDVDPSDTVLPYGEDAERVRVEHVPGVGAGVDAIVVVPAYDPVRQLWFCDVNLTTDSYFPIVSLAMARYQDHALAGFSLSPVSRAEVVQVAPDRVASIAVSGTTINVVVEGVSAGNAFERQGSLPPRETGTPADRPGGGHRVRARVERKTGGSDLDWTAVQTVELLGSTLVAGDTTVRWAGKLKTTTGTWRVVIEESELYAGEDHGTEAEHLGERITYVEVLPVP